jgi:hypothetical protein
MPRDIFMLPIIYERGAYAVTKFDEYTLHLDIRISPIARIVLLMSRKPSYPMAFSPVSPGFTDRRRSAFPAIILPYNFPQSP